MKLIKKIRSKNLTIGIIGLGYVGLPLLKGFESKNFKIIGFDTDKKKILKLRKGVSYINHIDLNDIHKNKKILFTSNFQEISNVDFIILCLPTPLKKNKLPDLSYIKKTMNLIKKYLKPYQAISLESTTYPGTTREIIFPVLNKKFKIGENFFLIYSPEREDPGRKNIKLQNIPKVLGGYSVNCKKIGAEFYKRLFKKIVLTKNLKQLNLLKFLKMFLGQ